MGVFTETMENLDLNIIQVCFFRKHFEVLGNM